MGAKHSLHEIAQELGLNEEEAVALHSLFSSLASDGSELSAAAVNEYFGCRCNDAFGGGLYAIMAKDGAPVTFDKFARAGVLCAVLRCVFAAWLCLVVEMRCDVCSIVRYNRGV
jgi:hypothetical protein